MPAPRSPYSEIHVRNEDIDQNFNDLCMRDLWSALRWSAIFLPCAYIALVAYYPLGNKPKAAFQDTFKKWEEKGVMSLDTSNGLFEFLRWVGTLVNVLLYAIQTVMVMSKALSIFRYWHHIRAFPIKHAASEDSRSTIAANYLRNFLLIFFFIESFLCCVKMMPFMNAVQLSQPHVERVEDVDFLNALSYAIGGDNVAYLMGGLRASIIYFGTLMLLQDTMLPVIMGDPRHWLQSLWNGDNPTTRSPFNAYRQGTRNAFHKLEQKLRKPNTSLHIFTTHLIGIRNSEIMGGQEGVIGNIAKLLGTTITRDAVLEDDEDSALLNKQKNWERLQFIVTLYLTFMITGGQIPGTMRYFIAWGLGDTAAWVFGGITLYGLMGQLYYPNMKLRLDIVRNTLLEGKPWNILETVILTLTNGLSVIPSIAVILLANQDNGEIPHLPDTKEWMIQFLIGTILVSAVLNYTGVYQNVERFKARALVAYVFLAKRFGWQSELWCEQMQLKLCIDRYLAIMKGILHKPGLLTATHDGNTFLDAVNSKGKDHVCMPRWTKDALGVQPEDSSASDTKGCCCHLFYRPDAVRSPLLGSTHSSFLE